MTKQEYELFQKVGQQLDENNIIIKKVMVRVDKLCEENKRLREENEQLRALLLRSA